MLGDNLGFWIGRTVGLRLVKRYGPYLHITEGRLRLGRYLFAQHGAKVVFFGRFVTILRALAALLAGMNGMAWGRFLTINIISGLLWAIVYGFGAYLLGGQAHRILGPTGLGLFVIAIGTMTVMFLSTHRYRHRLQAEADRLFSDEQAAKPDFFRFSP